MARGEFIDATASRITIGTLGEEWLANQSHLKPSTWHVVESAWRLYVQPAFGTREVGQIRPSEVQTWATSISRSKSRTTTVRAVGVLAGIFDMALKDRRIPSNPARGLNLPRKQPKQRRYLSHSQVQILADQSGTNSTLVLFLSYTGIRWGEAAGLRVGSIDMLRRRARVSENAVSVGGKIVVGSPKSHEERSVPLPRFLLEDLARRCEGKSREELVFGEAGRHLRTPSHRDGWFRSAKIRAKAIDPEFPLALTLHDLRHTAASLAISAGANVKAVQRMLGHASAAMTLDTYADLFDDDLDSVAESLDQAKANSDVGNMWAKEKDLTAIDRINQL